MDVKLVMFKSDGGRHDFPLRKDQLVIGRTAEAGLRIPLPSVSRKHCELRLDGDNVRLRDLGSSNGTLHNGTRVTDATLSPGDQIEVGPVVFTVVIDGQPADIDPVRSMVAAEPVDTAAGAPAINDEQPKQIDRSNEELPAHVEPEVDSPTVELDDDADPASALESLVRRRDAHSDDVTVNFDDDDEKQ